MNKTFYSECGTKEDPQLSSINWEAKSEELYASLERIQFLTSVKKDPGCNQHFFFTVQGEGEVISQREGAPIKRS